VKLVYSFIIAIISTLLLNACGNDASKPSDTQTAGFIKVSIDETYKPVMEQQLQVFQSRYPDAHILAEYKPEADCFKDFFEDSTRVIFVTRELSQQEIDFGLSKKIVTRSLPMARDAVAFIVGKNSKDTNITISKLRNILTGTDADKKYQIVFDNKNSSTVRFVTDSLIEGKKMSSNIFATNNSNEVIDYVTKNPNAMGVIGVCWIADTKDSTAGSFLKQVNVVGIYPEREGVTQYVKPYQAYIGLKDYPCTRDFYFITKETYPGLGTGFVNYLCRDGQLLFKQSKLFPLQVNVLLRETVIKNN
jgi:phosphate transport system substrate-binding protein